MVATPSIQSSAPSITLATLRATLAHLKAQEPERGIRWDRAASIVALRTVKPGYTAGWWVESECEAHKWYWVLPVGGRDTCSCPDFQQRGGPCKHALAVRVFQACEAQDQTAPCGGQDADILDLDPDAPIPYVLTPQGEAALALPLADNILLGGECPTCGALGRVLYGGRRARCEYCAM